jgi:hypothetical protein
MEAITANATTVMQVMFYFSSTITMGEQSGCMGEQSGCMGEQ